MYLSQKPSIERKWSFCDTYRNIPAILYWTQKQPSALIQRAIFLSGLIIYICFWEQFKEQFDVKTALNIALKGAIQIDFGLSELI